MKSIGIIGGGAAGLMAAISAAEEGASVTVVEKNAVCGKKLLITGKGRCNVTNTRPVRELGEVIPRGEKFLRTALYAFPPEEVQSFFEALNVPLKVERGGRVFPVSDKAAHVAEALIRRAEDLGVHFLKENVKAVKKTEEGFLVWGEKVRLSFDRLLIATGGASYPGTGSTGDGYRFAEALGHEIKKPIPSLVPLITKETLPAEAQGLSLKNCAVAVKDSRGKSVYEDFGELLFTHFGLSGPVILSASAYLDFQKEKEYTLLLDLKPALSEEALDKRILSDFKENQNRILQNSLDALLPQKLILPLIAAAGLDGRKKVNELTKKERAALLSVLKALPLTVTGTRGLKEAIITRGGVATNQIDPRRMESKLCPDLFFAGEILDVDALTGGFNLQIAFSTGRLAGKTMAQEEL